MLSAFVFKKADCENILSGTANWCIQESSTSKRGTFALTYEGQELIYGKATLVDVIPLNEDLFNSSYKNHHSTLTWEQLSKKYKHPYAWVFTNAYKFTTPILSNNRVSSSGTWIRDAIDDIRLAEEYKIRIRRTAHTKVVSSQETLVEAAKAARMLHLSYGEYVAQQMCKNIPTVKEDLQMAKCLGDCMTVRERMALKEAEAAASAATES